MGNRGNKLAFNGPLLPSWALTSRFAANFNAGSKVDGYSPDMTRIDDMNFDGVAFLFRTRQEAKKRVRGGGSAFLVGRPLAGGEQLFGRQVFLSYLVSNKHVVFGGSACVASVNRQDGGEPDIWDIDQNDWHPHPKGDDLVAACAQDYLKRSIHKVSFIDESDFITRRMVAEYNVGPGDEIFMIGRFYNLQGGRTNRPALRQGSISMMQEPIWVHEDKRFQDSFAVEMRSKEGFSGSPVAVWRKPWTNLADIPKEKCDFWALLGVNWGYIYDDQKENTWLNGVVPAWKISEVLDVPPLKKIHAEHERKIQERIAAKQKGEEPGAAKSVYASLEGDVEPDHRERFKRLLGAAVKSPKSSD